MSSKVLRNTDHPWLAVIVVAAITCTVMALQLSAHDWDPSYFIAIGDRYIVQPDQLPDNVQILPDSSGYDGQFYYQLALSPFWPQEVNAGLSISNGPYRHQRIMYPLLVWVFSLGRQNLVPEMLIVVNILALCIVAWLGARFANVHKRHAMWGMLFALYPGFLFTITRDLTEIVGAMFLLMAVLALYHRQSKSICTLLFVLAIFTRETAAIAIVALGVTLALTDRRERRVSWQVVVVPLIYFGVWQVALWANWERLPILAGGHNVGLPGVGLVAFVGSLDAGSDLHVIWGVEIGIMTFIVLVAAMTASGRSNIPLWHKAIWLGYTGLALSLTYHVWIEDIAFMRALSETFLFSLMLIVAGASRLLMFGVGIGTVAMWVLVFATRLDW